MTGESDLIEIELHIIRDEPTDQAILVQEKPTSPKIWIPRSAIRDMEYVGRSTLTNPIAIVTLPERLALVKGLI